MGTSPSKGQPNEVDKYPRTRRPAACARRATSAYKVSDSSMDELMLRRLKVSEAAAKTATSSTRALERPLEAARIGHERGVQRAGASCDAGEHLAGIRHLRHPARADERTGLDHRQAGGAEPIDERDLVGGGDDGVLVLQPVARAHFDDEEVGAAVHGPGYSSTSTCPGCTNSPSRQWTADTTPSRGALIDSPSSWLRAQ
jgi:hypothetical protein